MYKLMNTATQMIRRFNEDGSVTDIPMNPDNTSYQAYLKWLDEGNTPQPADSGE
jgi:hypothetical protein